MVNEESAMKPRERVLTALALREPDRVPIDYSSNPGIDGRLKEHYGLDPADDEGLRRELGVDFRWAGAPYVGPRLHEAPDDPHVRVSPDWGIRSAYIEHESGGYWEPRPHLQDLDEQTALEYPMPSPDDYDYAALAERVQDLSDYAVCTGPGFEVMNWTGRHVGHEAMYVGLATADPALMTFIERFVEIKYEILRRALHAAGDAVSIVWMGEDLGTQRGPRVSKQLFRERIRPVHQRFIDLAKQRALPVMVHSCGSSSWAFEDLIEMGVDAIDTLQPEAADMSPAYLKERFGDRLAFHGCISTAGPLARGTAEEVRKVCRETLEVMMPGGGYCFAPTHQIQDNTPTENVLAAYEVARTVGRYR